MCRLAMVSSRAILSPVFACEFLAGETAPRFEAGDVVLERSLGEVNMRIRFREETGELVECAALSPFGPTTPGSPAPAPRLSLKLDGHEFARLAQRADQDWAQLPYDPARRRPLADVVLASPLAKACVAKPELSRPFHLTTATLRFCERLFTTPELRARLEREGPSKGAAFTIPAGNAPSDSVGAAVSQTLLVCSRLLGPAQSWPSRLARELSDSFAGDSTRSAAMLDAIDADPTIGPLGSLLTAKLLQLAGSPGAWRFARRASERNQVEDFRNDLQTLFDGEAPPARLVRTLLAGLAALSDEEVAALGADLALEDRQLLEQAIGLLRATKAEGVTAALQPLMERWWSRQMQPQLAAKIHRIMTPEGDVDPVTIAAAINGQPVRRSLLELCRRQPELLLPLPRLPGPSHPTAPGQEHPDSALERLAILTLLLPEAAAAGVDLSDTAIDRDIKDAVHAQHAVDRSAFETSLSRDGTSLEDYRTLLRLNRAYEGMRQTYSQPPGQPGAWEAHLTGLRDTAFLYVLPIAPTSAQRTSAH